jgi:hypothetical protein
MSSTGKSLLPLQLRLTRVMSSRWVYGLSVFVSPQVFCN